MVKSKFVEIIEFVSYIYKLKYKVWRINLLPKKKIKLHSGIKLLYIIKRELLHI